MKKLFRVGNKFFRNKQEAKQARNIVKEFEDGSKLYDKPVQLGPDHRLFGKKDKTHLGTKGHRKSL